MATWGPIFARFIASWSTWSSADSKRDFRNYFGSFRARNFLLTKTAFEKREKRVD